MDFKVVVSRRQFLLLAGAYVTGLTLTACGSKPTPSAISVAQSTKSAVDTPSPTYNTESTKVLADPLFPEMVLVEPGTFLMGSDKGYRWEQPVHKVIISRPFEIGKYAVTYNEFDRYTEDIQKSPINLDVIDRGLMPASGVDWYDAAAYCNWLSEKAGLIPCYSGGGKVTICDFQAGGYRLPTEAEWEFAARGGTKSQGYLYSGSDDPDEVGWHVGNSDGHAHPVGQKQPNELGIYDMSGNRWEWCWDWFGSDYYAESPETDPAGPTDIPKGAFADQRSRRSSSAVQEEDTLRVAFRSYDGMSYPGDNGLRLVRTVI